MTEIPKTDTVTHTRSMRYATVCSGVEGMSLAVAGMGWKPVFFSETAPFPCAVLKHHYPDVPNLGDMREIKGEHYYGTVDFLAGGTPCQSFSIAGNRKGLGDERGELMLHFARLVHEIRPRWLLWENVPGCLSSSGGQDFAALLSSLSGWDVPVPKHGWRNSGVIANAPGCYGLAWRIFDAQYVRVERYARAVPQRRRRVWLVGHLGDWRRAAEILFVGEGVSRHPPPRREAREAAPAGTGGRAKGTGRGSIAGAITSCDAERGFTSNESATAGGHLVLHDTPSVCMNFEMFNVGKGIAPAILAERAADMLVADGKSVECPPPGGFGEYVRDDAGCARAANMQAIGGSVQLVLSLPNGQANSSVTKDCAGTLSCDHEAPIICLHDQGGELMEVCDGVTGTLTGNIARAHAPIVCCDAHSIRMRAGCEGGGKGALVGKNISHTLATRNDQTIVCGSTRAPEAFDPAHAKKIDVGMTVIGDHDARISDTTHLVCHPINSMVIDKDIKDGDRQTTGIGDDGDPCPTLQATHHHAVAAGMTVRRLMPLECERLMGFPGNYTLIPWRGKPAGDCPDAPRYKACGNSWAVNCARWVCMRIAIADEMRGGQS